MNNEFIPYEQALELKELGFNEPCFGWFTNSYLRIGSVVENKHVQGEDEILAPLYQQAFRWFREKYNITHEILRKEDNNHKEFMAWVYIEGARIEVVSYWFSTSYEEAELACVKKLIEVVKNK
jgi:hypothetical protein